MKSVATAVLIVTAAVLTIFDKKILGRDLKINF